MGINDPKNLTSTHRHSFGDRKNVHLFKTPSIPIRKARNIVKNKLKIIHPNAAINCTIVHKDYRSIVINNQSSYSTSSKSVNKRKRYKMFQTVNTRHLIVTPASNLILKRSREVSDSVYNNSKRRRLEAGTFQIEPIDEVDELCLKELFCTDHTVNIKFPDQNENLLCVPDDLREYKKKVCAAVQSIYFKSKIEPATTNEDMLNDCKNVELKLQRITSPIDVKYDSNSSTKLQDDKASIMDGIEIQHAATKDEVFDDPVDIADVKPVVVVTKENESEQRDADTAYGPPSTTYPGQLLWVLYHKCTYWPAIVCPPDSDSDETKGRINVKFFADRGRGGMVKKEDVVEFQGIDSFLQYKEAMVSKLSKSDWKSRFNVTNKTWAKAVVEITFALSRDVGMRLALFDIIVICTLRDTLKSPPSLSQLISQHSSSSQLEAVQNLFAENSNIFEHVKQELAKISSTIGAEALIRPAPIHAQKKPQTPAPTLTKQPNPITNSRQSLPSSLTKRRTSRRLTSKAQSPLSISLPIKLDKPQKCKDRRNPKEVKRIAFEKALESYTIAARQKIVLFKGLRRGNVCKECLTIDENLDRDLVKCSGDCVDHVHRKCATLTTTGSNAVRCRHCSMSSHICYACKEKCSESPVRCVVKECGRYYHSSCLDAWLQTKTLEPGKVMCPTHNCHTCASDDPQNTHFSIAKDSTFSRCIKCPTTYHAASSCIPAGVKILTANQHICIMHRKERRQPVYLNWCYICGGRGGDFICCDLCPLTSHKSCLPIKDPGDNHLCVSCETGRHPLHGEIVWVKYAGHPFWPAVIVPPACIPSVVKNRMHNDHDMCVRFFGSYEFGWVGRSFVYLYAEGDAQKTTSVKLDEAIEQAEEWYKKITIKVNKSEKIQPLPYLKIAKIKELAPAKLQKRKNNYTDPCDCSPDDPDPCGLTSECGRREACTECDSGQCPTGDKCQNQCIAKRKYASVRLKYFGDKGFGLIAEADIVAGTMVIEYVGELVTEEEYQFRLKLKQTQNLYFMKYAKGLYIDAEKKGNMSRFMNHSCNPNCETQVWVVKGLDRIALFAMRNIEKGEELTFNYGFDDRTHKCYCGEAQCRGFI